MSISDLSIRRPVFAWMLMIGLIVFGWLSFQGLGVSLQPDIDLPTISISATLEGASPEVMESDVVDPIESAILGVEGLKNISSTAQYGSASITLDFDVNRDIDAAVQEVQSKIAQAQRNLPQDLDPPIVSKRNPEDQPIIWFAVGSTMPVRQLMAYARDELIPQFQLVPGVGDVFLGGYLEPNVRIWLDLKKMQQLQLTVDDLINTIGQEHVEYPAGALQKGEQEFNLRVMGEAGTVQEIADLPITRRGGAINYRLLKIKDIARVEAGTEDVRRISRVLGKSAVGIGIRKQRGTNTVEVANAAKERMELLKASLPKDTSIGINFDSTKFIEESVHELNFELILAALLTGVVCFVFLGSLSSTINILLAIPTSLVGAFMAFKYFGFTLNFFTLLALILAVGIVVDDAIMVLENIVRQREKGKTRLQAARDGANQISFAAMATTFAIVAIFLPIAFMPGLIGKYFFQFAIVLSVAVLISLLEALTLTPMRCSQYLAMPNNDRWFDRKMHQLMELYKKSLVFVLNWRKTTFSISILIFLASLFLLKVIKQEMVPSQDQGLFMVRLVAPVGSSLEYMNEKAKKIEEIVLATPELNRYYIAVGGFGSGGEVNTAMMFITIKEMSEREASQQDIMSRLRKSFAEVQGVRAVVMDRSVGGFSSRRGFPIEFTVRGPDWKELVGYSKDIMEKLKTDGRYVDIDSNYQEGMPEVKVYPNRDMAARRGVSVEDIGKAVGFLVGGNRVGRFTESGRRIDVRVRLEEEYRNDPKAILELPVRNSFGELVKLSEVTTIEEKETLLSITREQRQRAITITSNVAQGASQADLVTYLQTLNKDLPAGYSLVLSGSSQELEETFSSLTMALYLGILIAYMILASQFNSFIHPISILLSLPFSVTGALLALYLGGASLNLYSFIGLILLMGIVKKNSIMLVDFTNQIREEDSKVTAIEALTEACPVRLRPILMTSITIVSASFPSVLGLGPGSETRVPMSLAVIGGVTISTLFTLYVVPAVYSLLDDLTVYVKARAKSFTEDQVQKSH